MSKKEAMQARITVRFYTSDYRKLVEAARSAGIPVVEYIRRIILKSGGGNAST